ncbi:fumarylacetoacetate hydrolase family protein [Desulfobacter sp.]|uniref:fumarylacetoacetate hydrolase family protein n=1 Tax=Desulfobacter sp. TaxID=2294 RepID=UPI003D0F0112
MKIIRFITRQGTEVMGCDWDGHTACLVEQSADKSFSNTGERVDVVRVLPPVAPPAIICIGLNYRRHAKETGQEIPKYPAVFMKYPGSLAGHGDAIVIPECASDPPEVDYEAELGVIIKTAAKNVPEDKALDYVLGYTCTNDVSARRWQKHAGAFQWTRGKSYDTFCPCGPVMTTADEITDPQNLAIKCRLNGEIMQDSHTSDMVFSIANMISYLSQSSTLLPGTLILTGTPEGVGFTRKPRVYLAPGDRMEVEIEGIGVLENPVEKER